MTDLFTIVHPPMPLEFQSIMDFINASYVLGLKAQETNGVLGLKAEETNGKVEDPFRLLIRGKRNLPDPIKAVRGVNCEETRHWQQLQL